MTTININKASIEQQKKSMKIFTQTKTNYITKFDFSRAYSSKKKICILFLGVEKKAPLSFAISNFTNKINHHTKNNEKLLTKINRNKNFETNLK